MLADVKAFESLSPQHQEILSARASWLACARPSQITPENCGCHEGGKWLTWLLLGGRGAGKTRTGAEDAAWFAATNPCIRYAIVAPTFTDARDTCVEGVSGLLSVLPKSAVRSWNRSHGELILYNDSRFKLFSAEEPDRLRGPQYHRAWCDELAAWRYEDAWDQLIFGLRLGKDPRVIVTTTPRPTALVRKLLLDKKTHITRDSTFANEANLAPTVLAAFKERYAGTRLGRQELEAEMLDDVPGSLWNRANLDANRKKKSEVPDLQRVVVGVDPAVADAETAADGHAETGIVVAGLGIDGHAYVLDDLSCRLDPVSWARRAVSGIDLYDGDCIVAETNQGGAMVTSTIKSVRPTVKVKTVHASRGKVTRAEPISALYEQGRVHHVGSHVQVEDQMIAFTSAGIVGGTTGDRVDALVWALTELFPSMTKKTSTGRMSVESVRQYQPHNF